MKDRNLLGIYLIGKSPAITHVMDYIEKFAKADSNVLIRGHSGTGKEVVAKLLHNLSGRSRGPFVALNCAALPDTLVESELFGWKKGSFTHASEDRMGRFEAAKGGTIFLDEIGDMPLAVQVKLLRPLQERSIQRLGENQDRPIDCRVIAATSRDLEKACENGTFREDLYYRLAVAIIKVPPLSERTEDIPLLVDHFLEKLTLRMYGPGRPAPRISDEAMDAVMRYSFPGNIRELENALERSILLSDGKLIGVENLPDTIREGARKIAVVNPHCRPSARLLEALEALFSGSAGPRRNLRQPGSIRVVKVEDIALYLSETEGHEFSRKDFELFLRRRGRHDMTMSAYATAGRYLHALIEAGVLKHNAEKSNRRRFRLMEDCLADK